MSRLFVRLWFASIALSVVGVIVHEVVSFHFWSEGQYDNEEQLILPGLRDAARQLAAAQGEGREAVLAQLSEAYGMDTAVLGRDAIPPAILEELDEGDGISYWFVTDCYVVPIPGQPEVFALGPLPPMAMPDIPSRLAVVALLCLGFAAAFGLILHRLGREHLALEQASARIAAGELSLRIDDGRTLSPQLVSAFNHLAERTEHLVNSQQARLSYVSHELRNQVSALQLSVPLLADTADGDDRARRLESIRGELEELGEFINELLAYSRLESVDEPPRKAQLDLEPVARDLVAARDPPAGKSVALGPRVASEQPALWAEPRMLSRVLRNLLDNAAHHAVSRVELDAWGHEGGVTLVVDDDGPGVPAADRDEVTRPFVQRQATPGRGHGLGLAMAVQIVRHHGGTLAIGDSPLGGCRVETWWPGDDLQDPT